MIPIFWWWTESISPLVDSNIWNAAQDRISQLKAMHKYHGRPLGSGKDWISGVVRCASCGGTYDFCKAQLLEM